MSVIPSSNAEKAEDLWMDMGLAWADAAKKMWETYELQRKLQTQAGKAVLESVLRAAASDSKSTTAMVTPPGISPEAASMAARSMQAFAIEIMLKGALASKGHDNVGGHDLDKLFDRLCTEAPGTEERCDRELARQYEEAHKVAPHITSHEVDGVREIFKRHRFDFEEFRYGQPKTKGQRQVEPDTPIEDAAEMAMMPYVLQAVLIEKADTVSQQKRNLIRSSKQIAKAVKQLIKS